MPRPGSTPSPRFKRGGNSLPYGVAGAANEAMEYKPVGEEEEFIFGRTDRPMEPITAGAPFGPGPDIAPQAPEGAGEFLARVTESMTQSATPEVQKFISKVTDRAARGL